MTAFTYLPWIGIAVATVVAFLLGGAWYSPPLFGNRWMTALGKTKEELGAPGPAMAITFGTALLTSIGVAMIEQRMMLSTMGAVRLGLTLGVLIQGASMLSDQAFTKTSRELLFIQVGYRILMLVAISVILQLVWR